MSRRKHILQKVLQNDIDPPTEGQRIVRAAGSRGSNIMEVEFPDGSRTLSLLPAKFHKKLWIKRGNFLIIEDADDSEAAVTGQIVQVLFADHVKQFKKLEGVWPPEFDDDNNDNNTNTDKNDGDHGDDTGALFSKLDIHDNNNIDQESGADTNDAPLTKINGNTKVIKDITVKNIENDNSNNTNSGHSQALDTHPQDMIENGCGIAHAKEEADHTRECSRSRSSSSSSEDDDLPPLERIQNRKIIEYEVSESDSDDT